MIGPFELTRPYRPLYQEQVRGQQSFHASQTSIYQIIQRPVRAPILTGVHRGPHDLGMQKVRMNQILHGYGGINGLESQRVRTNQIPRENGLDYVALRH